MAVDRVAIRSLVVDKAIEMVNKGWCQGISWVVNPDGTRSVCMTHALTTACVNTSVICLCWAILDDAKKKSGKTASRWNDMPGRTKEEVIEFLQSLKVEESSDE